MKTPTQSFKIKLGTTRSEEVFRFMYVYFLFGLIIRFPWGIITPKKFSTFSLFIYPQQILLTHPSNFSLFSIFMRRIRYL